MSGSSKGTDSGIGGVESGEDAWVSDAEVGPRLLVYFSNRNNPCNKPSTLILERQTPGSLYYRGLEVLTQFFS